MPSSTSAASPRDPRPIIISGPSGVGKGTLIQKLLDAHLNPYISPSEFTSLISEYAFVEDKFFSRNYYGTSKKTAADQEARGLVAVLDIEIEGVKQIKRSPSIDARYVLIKPPSLDLLEARLRGRGTESEEQIQKRLAQGRLELGYAETPGVYHVVTIINDDLDKTHKELEGFVYESR
ncbi:hypothetical protein FZEAL_6565 [Fusarium zealandicum]|uniref:Guanylate kinase-like domain-containing protein n=1 Tax=Fusarium zealandicum TaxID=1053134 RepID=A0A8H4UIB1_9HYPO|nr:hypothetical protein FZEAL_6565 [Fusarium zealandicum]